MKSSFLIVADRGNLKAYRLEKAPTDRPHHVHLVQALSLADAHAKIGEVNTDVQGRRSSDGSVQVGGTGERHYDLENNRRSARELADHIKALLKEHKPEAWSFAAPSGLNQSVLDELEPNLRNLVAENLQRDLVKVSPNDLLNHFTATRAA